jgi:uncharacterized protein
VLEVLDRPACVELLQSVAIGRVAWATESGDAVVVPVNFVEVRWLQLLPLAPWDPQPKRYFVRIRASEMTGRRLPLKAGGVTVEHSGDETD